MGKTQGVFYDGLPIDPGPKMEKDFFVAFEKIPKTFLSRKRSRLAK